MKETLQLWTVVWGAVIKRYLRCCRSSYSFLYLFKNRRRTIESSSKRNNEPRLSWTPGMLGGSDSTRSNAVGFLQRGPRTSRGLWPGPDVAVNGGGFVALTVPYFSFSVIVSFQLFFTWFIHGGGCSVSCGRVCSYSPPGVDALRALNETNSGVLLIVREFLVCQGFPGWSAGLYQSAPAALDRRATGNRFLDYFISNATFLLREQKWRNKENRTDSLGINRFCFSFIDILRGNLKDYFWLYLFFVRWFFSFFIVFIWVCDGRKCPDQEAEVKVSVSVTLEQMPSLGQTLKMIFFFFFSSSVVVWY